MIRFGCRTGFIPMNEDNESFQKEYQRQQEAGFPPCGCQVCKPQECLILIRNLHLLCLSNFDEGLHNPKSVDPETAYSEEAMDREEKDRARKRNSKKRKKENLSRDVEDDVFLDLMYELTEVFKDCFNSIYKGEAPFPASTLFGNVHLNRIVKSIESIHTEDDLSQVIGGSSISGVNRLIFGTLSDWKSDSRGELHYRRIEEQRKKT